MQPLAAVTEALFATVDGCGQLAQLDLVEVGAELAHPTRAAEVARYAWTNCTAIAPSPTAVAHRFVDPERTSPAANTPGKLVPRRSLASAASPVRMKPSSSRPTASPSHSVQGSA